MHLPSAVKEWQQPEGVAAPIIPSLLSRPFPLDEQEASYFAASARILSFSYISTKPLPFKIRTNVLTGILFYNIKENVSRAKMYREREFLPIKLKIRTTPFLLEKETGLCLFYRYIKNAPL